MIARLLAHFPEGVKRLSGPGTNNFKLCEHLFSADDECLASVYHGGHNPHPNVKASGGDDTKRADQLAGILRAEFPAHRVTRLDSAIDLRGDYYTAERSMYGVWRHQRSKGRKLRDNKHGGPSDRVPGVPDELEPDAGHTYELGSGFPHKVRLYEKGKERYAQTGNPFWLDHFDLFRLELQTRPEKAGKSIAATMGPEAVWGCAEWLRQVKHGVLAMDAEPIRLKAPRAPDHERALRAMFAQYGPTLLRHLEMLGSVEAYTLDHLRRLGVVADEESPQAA